MNTNTSVVKGNQTYDPVTGQLIKTIRTASQRSNQVIDGFVRGPLNSIKTQPKSAIANVPQQSIKATKLHQPPQKPKTLIRDGLKKPASTVQTRFKRFGSAHAKTNMEFRSKTVPKHFRVSRFGSFESADKPPAKHQPRKQPVSGELLSAGGQTAGKKAAAPAQAATASKSIVATTSHQKLERMLDHALANADAHKQALHYQATRHFWQHKRFTGHRKIAWLAAIVFVIMLSAFIAWQRVPSLSVRLAGMKTHLRASVPAYKPDGYSMAGPAKVQSGSVTINYKSDNFPEQNYAIEEAPSNMTSTSLAQTVVPKGKSVQTSQVDGNTVYIYGSENNAAWVSDGTLYKINNSANLNSDQLIKIVHGLNQ